MPSLTKTMAASGCLLISAMLLVSGCQLLTGSDGNNQAVLIKSEKTRQLHPDVAAAELSKLVQENSQFALDLYRQIGKEPGNQFFSPLSISLALAMTYGGARGKTMSEMAEALRFTLSAEKLHPAFNALDLSLSGPAGAAKDFELAITNATWGQHDYRFLETYLDLLAVNYGAAMRLLDFFQEPEPSRKIINQWVSGQTNGKIEDLLPEGSITPATVLVLTNAIYFNAKWLTPFPKQSTADGPFTRPDGTAVSVPMMSAMLTLPIAESDGVVAIELPYKHERFSMVILMPAVGQLSPFESSLTGERLAALLGALRPAEALLTLPKFSFSADYDLVPLLQQLGMKEAFVGGRADFSGMDSSRNLFISAVVHKAFVAVDEEGTEAAAATGVVVGRTSLPQYTITIDHPFLFLIRDRETGSLLFLGRVVNPEP